MRMVFRKQYHITLYRRSVRPVVGLDERGYRERCSMRLLEIMLDIDQYRGTRRVFIP
jgi:hypothetical protein